MADASAKERAYPRITTFLATFSWAFYDFANTIYSMNIVTMYFAQWVVVDLGLEDIFYGISFSASMVMVAVTVPVLGAAADAWGRRLGFLFWFTVCTCAFTASLALAATIKPAAAAGAVALALFCLANYFYGGSLAFYNALLPGVSSPANIGRVSGAGVAFSYAGTIVGLVMVLPFVEGMVPGLGSGRPAAFVPTALLFALFALPTFLWVKEPRITTARRGLTSGLRKVAMTLRESRRRPAAFRFLLAKFLYEDPIMTAIMFMAVYAGEVMDMPDTAKVPLFIVSTLFAVAGAFAAGYAVDRAGAKKTLMFALVGWAFTFAFIGAAARVEMLWVGGALVGLLLGATWTSARPLYIELVPADELGEYFGLYALSGKAAAIVGPLVWGSVVLAARGLGPAKYRLAVISLAAFSVAGLIVLSKVKTPAPGDAPGRRAANTQ